MGQKPYLIVANRRVARRRSRQALRFPRHPSAVPPETAPRMSLLHLLPSV
jgi:hypothetical protein